MIVHHHHHHHDDGDDGDDDELPLGISARSKLEDSVVFTGECDEVDHHCLTYKKTFLFSIQSQGRGQPVTHYISRKRRLLVK